LAEWLCRTAYRIDPARVCGPFHPTHLAEYLEEFERNATKRQAPMARPKRFELLTPRFVSFLSEVAS
jgi:hypothetical protein